MKICFRLAFHALLLFAGFGALPAQKIVTPDGETVISVSTFTGTQQNRLATTRTTLYCSQYSAANGWSESKALYQTAPGVQITDGALKTGETGDTRTVALLLNNGRVVLLTYNATTQSGTVAKILDAAPATGGGGGGIIWQKVVLSDMVYVRVSNVIYSQPLAGGTWKQENIGLGNLGIQDIAFDATNRVLGGTNSGLFQLLGDGSGWQRFASFDSAARVSGIFQLSGNKLYVGSNRGTFLSTTQGATWQRDTAVIGVAALTRLIELADGTLAGSSNLGQQGTSPSALWKKESGASSWSRFENSLTAAAGGTLRVNDLAGETTIEVASVFGCFSSGDKGAQWTHSVKGIQAEEIYGYLVSPTHTFISTGTGIFRMASGQSWEKIYPVTGFVSGRPLFRTTSPDGLATQLSATIVGQSVRHGAILGSADNGQTWTPDTTGLAAVPYSQQITPILSVDNQGTKFFGVTGSNGTPVRVWKSSGAWAIDTAGMADMINIAGTQLCSAIATDYSVSATYLAGGIYTGTQFTLQDIFLFRKIRPDSAWIADTIGLNKSVVTAMTSTKTDEMYAGSALSNGVSRILKRGANGWEQFISPPTAISDVRAISVDENGAVYVAFSPVINNNTPNRGAYLTTDGGKTWDYAGLDSISVRGLTPGTDGMYGFTNRGVYKLSKQELKNPQITLNNRSIDYGNLEVGKTRDTVITIGNTGNDTLRISNIRSGVAEFTAIPTSLSIAPGASKPVVLRFAPTTAGLKSATFRTTSNTFPDSINVSGVAVASATVKMTVSTKILHFDTVTVGTNKDLYFTVKSEGTDTLRVFNIVSSQGSFTVNPTTFNLAAGDTQSVRVRFRPNSVGERLGQIAILTNTTNDTLRFDGTGTAPASAEEYFAAQLSMNIHPNPSAGNALLRLTLVREQYVTIRLTDVLGQEVASVFEGILPEGKHAMPVGSAGLSGVFLLKVTTPEGTATIRFVAVR